MSSEPPGFELPLRLFLAFRVIIDELHAELAREGTRSCGRCTASSSRPSA